MKAQTIIIYRINSNKDENANVTYFVTSLGIDHEFVTNLPAPTESIKTGTLTADFLS